MNMKQIVSAYYEKYMSKLHVINIYCIYPYISLHNCICLQEVVILLALWRLIMLLVVLLSSGYTTSDLSWPKVSDPLERLGSPLEFGWGMVSHLNGVKNNQELREAYQQAQPSVVMVSSKLAQSETIYNAMKVSAIPSIFLWTWRTKKEDKIYSSSFYPQQLLW